MTGAKSPGTDAVAMVNPGAAATDIGSTMHIAAINPQADDNPIRTFGTFTGDLHEMARRFKTCGMTSVAMESTSVYWLPAHEVLEQPRELQSRSMPTSRRERTDMKVLAYAREQFRLSLGSYGRPKMTTAQRRNLLQRRLSQSADRNMTAA